MVAAFLVINCNCAVPVQSSLVALVVYNNQQTPVVLHNNPCSNHVKLKRIQLLIFVLATNMQGHWKT
jgi:hypothetical protein